MARPNAGEAPALRRHSHLKQYPVGSHQARRLESFTMSKSNTRESAPASCCREEQHLADTHDLRQQTGNSIATVSGLPHALCDRREDEHATFGVQPICAGSTRIERHGGVGQRPAAVPGDELLYALRIAGARL